MSNPQYSEFTYTVLPGASVRVERHSEFVTIIDASDTFGLQIDNFPETTFRKGLGYQSPTSFTSMRFVNRSQTQSLTITIAVGSGGVRDARLTLPGDLVAFLGAGREIVPRKVEVASGQRVELAGVDVERLELVVSSSAGNSTVWIGDDTVTNLQGLPIPSQGQATLTYQCAIYAYNQGSETVTLSILEVKK